MRPRPKCGTSSVNKTRQRDRTGPGETRPSHPSSPLRLRSLRTDLHYSAHVVCVARCMVHGARCMVHGARCNEPALPQVASPWEATGIRCVNSQRSVEFTRMNFDEEFSKSRWCSFSPLESDDSVMIFDRGDGRSGRSSTPRWFVVLIRSQTAYV